MIYMETIQTLPQKFIHILLPFLGIFGGIFFSLTVYAQPEIEIGKSTFSAPPSEGQVEQVQQSHEDATCTLEAIYGAFMTIWESKEPVESWNEHRFFVEWLGRQKEGAPELSELKTRLETILGWMQNDEIDYRIHNSRLSFCNLAHANAYTNSVFSPRTINVCPYWFDQSPRERSSTLIHELIHALGFGHPDGVVLPADAFHLALRDAEKARRSPENYEGLANEYYCKP